MGTAPLQLSGLAKQLIAAGIISSDKALSTQQEALKEKQSLISFLLNNKIGDQKKLTEFLSNQLGMVVFDIDSIDSAHQPVEAVSAKVARQNRAVPLLKRGTKLFIGVADPSNQKTITDLQFATGHTIEAILIDNSKIDSILGKLYESAEEDFDASNLDLDVGAPEDEDNAPPDPGDDEKVVGFVNKMLLDAIKGGSSDLHFEPYEKAYRVRFRTDGMLHEVSRPPLNMSARIAARLKVMSAMDISEKRKPQDGRIKLKLSKTKAIDFRVNTCPTLWGEKIVMRILDPSSAQMGIDALGYEDEQKKLYLDALAQPQGMILVTGPTGSGKTVSLYTGINILNTPDINISTAEDPVEINLEGINQVNVNPRQGMDFNQALRAFLRQDPDVIMVGEIRDIDTASIAVKAAQTGHMVMSTLHTNGAAETLTRLRQMGLPSFSIATSVNLIIAQRLARRLCSSCKQQVEVPRDVLLKEGFKPDEVDSIQLYGPVGCDNCKSGYKGRVGIYEVVKITQPIARVIMEDGNSIEIGDKMREEGFNDLRRSGLIKAMSGLTSLEEVNRVTKE